MTIKKGDKVKVMAGRAKGSMGVVEKVFEEKMRVAITGVNLRKRHIKPTQQSPRGGITEFAGPIARASVMVVCPHCSKTTRIKHSIGETGKKFRSCSFCAGSLDTSAQ